MILKQGMRLRSAVCKTEIIVLAADGDVDIRCGGQPMGVTREEAKRQPSVDHASGTQVGKRYFLEDPQSGQAQVKVLCVASGDGSLSVGDAPLHIESPRPLPASD